MSVVQAVSSSVWSSALWLLSLQSSNNGNQNGVFVVFYLLLSVPYNCKILKTATYQ